jgi:short-subunit dehydrogenase
VKLRDAHVAIVGGSKGVGAALALELAGRGCKVTVLARDSEELRKVAAEAGGAALPVDLTDLGSLDGLIDRIESSHSPIDVLVSNAALGTTCPIEDLSAEMLRRTVSVNLVSHLELNRQLIPRLIQRGGGVLAIVGSACTETSMIHLSSYAPAKAGLVKFGLDMGNELRHTGITVPVFNIGSVPGTQLSIEGTSDPVIAYINQTLGRVGVMTPEAVASRIATVLAKGPRSAFYSVPRMQAPIVQFRQLPLRLLDPIMVRPALKAARRAKLARASRR